MKKYLPIGALAILLMLACCLFPSNSQAVISYPISIDAATFPDAVFRNYVINNLNGGSTILTQAAADSVSQIIVDNMGISSLQGIEYFPHITLLWCNYNQIDSIDLSHNTALTSLSCYNNQLKSLDCSHSLMLSSLNCDNNNLISLNISQNAALRIVSLRNNALTSLDVSQNTALIKLDCSGNQLASLGLSHNLALTSLSCIDDQLTSLDFSYNTALTSLECNANHLIEPIVNPVGRLMIGYNPQFLAGQTLTVPLVSDGAGGYKSINTYNILSSNGNTPFSDGSVTYNSSTGRIELSKWVNSTDFQSYAGYITFVPDKWVLSGTIHFVLSSQVVPTVTRLGGTDRYATAVEIAKKGWPTGASTVILAVGTNYPDALAATPLAAIKDAPILLTTTASTPAVTMTEIKTLKPTNIILLGSTASISASQATTFKNAGYTVTRYGGANRYETAKIIGNVVETLGGSKTAILVTGVNYPDALSMGSIAGMNKMPIIFSTATDLPAETKTFFSENKISKIVSVGYTAFNAAIETATESAVGATNVTYIIGVDRYDTSLAIAWKYHASFANGITVATGANFPDALTGGPLAAKLKFPVLLVNPATGATVGDTTYVIKGLSNPAIYVYGSTATLTDAIVKGLYQ